jgi:hypothetical protein
MFVRIALEDESIILMTISVQSSLGFTTRKYK